MARKIKEKSKPAPSNVTAGLVQHWAREVAGTARILAEASGAHRARLKAAKNAGIDPKLLIAGMNARKRDTDQVMSEVKNGLRYLNYLGLPIGSQQDFFGEALDADDNLTDSERAQHTAFEVAEAGYAAGRTGQNRDSNPHHAGSPHFVSWDAQYLSGQAAIAAEMGPGVTQVSAGRRGRKGNPEDGRSAAEA